jgi:transcriptional regulator with XRE-family HTH domain
MTTTPERRTATLSELVAEEIRALMGRRRMTQAQLARGIGKTEMWVSLRLRGKQALDMNDLHLIAGALEVGIHELLPPPAVAATAAEPTSGHATLFVPTHWVSDAPNLHVDNRPPGRRDSSRPSGERRTARVVKRGRPNAA